MSAMLAQADEALYCAKERGRNRIEVASLQMALDRAQERWPAGVARAGAEPGLTEEGPCGPSIVFSLTSAGCSAPAVRHFAVWSLTARTAFATILE